MYLDGCGHRLGAKGCLLENSHGLIDNDENDEEKATERITVPLKRTTYIEAMNDNYNFDSVNDDDNTNKKATMTTKPKNVTTEQAK